MRDHQNPAMIAAEFVAYMANAKVAEHKRKEAVPAVTVLFSLLRPAADIFHNPLVSGLIRNASTSVTRRSKYREIWDLDILLQHIRKGPPVDKLSWEQLMTRAAAIFMVFVPLRPMAMIRLDPSNEKRGAPGKSIEVCGHDKTDSNKSVTFSAIRPLEDKRLCPLTFYELLKSGAGRRGCTNTLFCSDSGKPYTRTDKLLKSLKLYIHEAGISEVFTAYSIRHATITKLYRMRLEEKQVNAYTGHSNNAHTTLNYYYHLNNAWVGSRLADLATCQAEPMGDQLLSAEIHAEEQEEVHANQAVEGVDEN
jgi:integrase